MYFCCLSHLLQRWQCFVMAVLGNKSTCFSSLPVPLPTPFWSPLAVLPWWTTHTWVLLSAPTSWEPWTDIRQKSYIPRQAGSLCRLQSWLPTEPLHLDRPQIFYFEVFCCSLFSHSRVSNSLQPHGQQTTRLPCPSLSLGVCSDLCPLCWWCHPTISSFLHFLEVLKMMDYFWPCFVFAAACGPFLVEVSRATV